MDTKRYRGAMASGMLALLLLLSVITAGAQGETRVQITQVDNSKFPNVTVYVSVTDAAGQPVGVDPSTLQISENGQSMQITGLRGGGEAGAAGVPVSTMLVIDISGSMLKNDKLSAAKNAAQAYVSQMRPEDQAGLITYDTHVYNVQPVTSDRAALSAAIEALQAGSDTAMYDALMEAETALAALPGRKAIIVLTDGLDNRSRSTEDDVVAGIGQSGLSISAIGFGNAGTLGQSGLDEAALKSVAQRSGGQYAVATDAAMLSMLYQQYGRALQSEYAITYVSPSTLRDGVNRGLMVTIAASGATAQGKYNPGGVLPEVVARSWSLFGAIGVGLLAMLFVPLLLAGGGKNLGGRAFKRKSRIKLVQAAEFNKAKGRVKLR